MGSSSCYCFFFFFCIFKSFLLLFFWYFVSDTPDGFSPRQRWATETKTKGQETLLFVFLFFFFGKKDNLLVEVLAKKKIMFKCSKTLVLNTFIEMVSLFISSDLNKQGAPRNGVARVAGRLGGRTFYLSKGILFWAWVQFRWRTFGVEPGCWKPGTRGCSVI